MKIINLTPHAITMIASTGEEITLISEGNARCVSTTEQVAEVNGFPVNHVTMGDVTGLPEEVDGTVYVVSRIVADAVKGKRNDCLTVDKTVRNAEGQIIGCTAFARV